jgi:hypothetical protein
MKIEGKYNQSIDELFKEYALKNDGIQKSIHFELYIEIKEEECEIEKLYL